MPSGVHRRAPATHPRHRYRSGAIRASFWLLDVFPVDQGVCGNPFNRAWVAGVVPATGDEMCRTSYFRTGSLLILALKDRLIDQSCDPNPFSLKHQSQEGRVIHRPSPTDPPAGCLFGARAVCDLVRSICDRTVSGREVRVTQCRRPPVTFT